MVWLSNKNLPLKLLSQKLSSRFIWSFNMLWPVNLVMYRLQLSASLPFHPFIPCLSLKPANMRQTTLRTLTPSPRTLLANLVNLLLDSYRRKGCRQNLVDWERYSHKKRSWVNASNILDLHLQLQFCHEHPDRPVLRSRGHPKRRLQGDVHRGGDSVITMPAFPTPSHQRKLLPEYWVLLVQVEYFWFHRLLNHVPAIDCCKVQLVFTLHYVALLFSLFALLCSVLLVFHSLDCVYVSCLPFSLLSLAIGFSCLVSAFVSGFV